MIYCHWIVCERERRWSPALRVAAERCASPGLRHRIHEVRSLREATLELTRRPTSIAAIEAHSSNFADVLAWIAEVECEFPATRCIALCDGSLDSPDAAKALREAGALEIAHTPRQSSAIVEFGVRHASIVAQFVGEHDSHDTLSITTRVWAALPWQDA